MTIKVQTDENEFHELQHRWRLWKADLQTFNLRIAFFNSHEVHRKQMMNNIRTSQTSTHDENNLNLNVSFKIKEDSLNGQNFTTAYFKEFK